MSNSLKSFFFYACVVCVFVSQISCTRFIETATRKIDDSKQDSYTSQSSNNPKPLEVPRIRDDRPFADFQREILNDFKTDNFDAIDNKANKARRDKERFTGGYWKIAMLYDSLTKLYGEDFQTEESWQAHLAKVEKWKQKSPDSITARIVLAESYTAYGWFARGTGFSDTVTDKDRNKLHERLELAYNELLEAKRVKDKCPEWYEAMLFLAMAQDWDADDYDRLLEEAIRFQPDYYYYYYSKAENSLPRWGGTKGDIERFAARIEKVNSKEQNILYYLYVSNLFNSYFDEITNPQNISWEKAKLGYKELEKKYGIDKQRLNQYSFIASSNEDMPEAYNAFKKIGNDWDDEVYSEKRFNEIKSWAIARYEAENPK
jgi:hypothetical protein